MKKLLIVSLGVSFLSISSQATQEKPNILVFLVDDMGLMNTSVPFLTDQSGQPHRYPLNKFYRTPGMERLANQGVRFGRFYANSVSSPTRASIMTGQSSARHHTTQWISPYGKNQGPKNWNWKGLTEKSVTLPRVLKSSGYRTIMCGKGHFGPLKTAGADPLQLGFDVNIGGSAIGQPGSYYGQNNYTTKKHFNPVPGLEKYHGTDTFLTEALTLEAKLAVDKAVQDKKPFYLYMSHYALHRPFQADPRFTANYKDSGKSKDVQAFATLVEGMDKSLTDLMDELERLGVAEDTIIIFLGDNGSDGPLGRDGNFAADPIRGKKGNSYDGGLRVPFIAAWAKVNPENKFQKKFPIKQGFYNQGIGTIEDIFPTVLKFAGVDKPKGYVTDGTDLTSYFATRKGNKPQTFLMHFPHSHNSSNFTSYINGDWKIIYNYGKARPKGYGNRSEGESVELFNLAKDPYEQHDLASSQPEKLVEMKKLMIKALDAAGAQYRTNQMTGKEMRPHL
jgi:arylsulfatase A-like enzyme